VSERHLILGTAGHVDHGKSALIKALTGTETDRLKEERERGISIELGFAELPLDGGITLGVVDVPGHERFVRQMVAGAGGVDLALLVVAADEGVMPQTVEHLEILQSLGVRGGVVAITKTDLVDQTLVEVVAEEVRDLAAGTFLEDRPLVPVSAVSGAGLDDLRRELREQAAAVPERGGEGPLRLPVDRIFTLPGAGVVVTGTCWSGEVRVGDTLVLEPGGRKVRVREVQSHGRDVPVGRSGMRLALALHGVKRDEVARGDQVAAPGACTVTRRLDARVHLVPHFRGVMKHRSRVHVHHAGREVLGRVVLLDAEQLSHDSGTTTALVQLFLEEPLVARPGDRFVLRFYSPLDTMAGGRILAVDPPRRKRFREEDLRELAVLEEGRPEEIFLQRLAEAAGEGLPAAGNEAFADLDPVLVVGKRLYHRDWARRTADAVAALLAKVVAERPLRGGVPREEARRKVGFPGGAAEWAALCAAIGPEAGWEVAGDRIVPRGGLVLPDALQRTVDAVEAWLREAGLVWPGEAALTDAVPEVAASGYRPDEFLRYLQARGCAVAVTPDYPVHADALADLRRRLAERFAAQPRLSFADFRDLSGLSRKLGIPLLEYLDSVGWTRRDGDERIPGPNLEG